MTTEKLKQLTPEQKRILIGKARGWKRKVVRGITAWKHPDRPFMWESGIDSLPDYLTDLGDIADAVRAIPRHGNVEAFGGIWSSPRSLYVCALLCVVEGIDLDEYQTGVWGFTLSCLEAVESATAAQKADAFLLTLDRWKAKVPCPSRS